VVHNLTPAAAEPLPEVPTCRERLRFMQLANSRDPARTFVIYLTAFMASACHNLSRKEVINMQPRHPDREELEALQDYVLDHDRTRHPRGVMKWAGLYPAVVFDDYEGEEGGYKGKIMIVVWPERPEYHEVLTFDQTGRLEPVKKDPAMYDPEQRMVYRDHPLESLREYRDLLADPTPLL
jgi:hypothetical protein